MKENQKKKVQRSSGSLSANSTVTQQVKSPNVRRLEHFTSELAVRERFVTNPRRRTTLAYVPNAQEELSKKYKPTIFNRI